ncbi:MAG: hypothetical protein ACLQM6_04165 [Acidobacteriaceae bacterium]
MRYQYIQKIGVARLKACANDMTFTVPAGEFQSAVDAWGDGRTTQAGRQFAMNVPARDAVVAMLR